MIESILIATDGSDAAHVAERFGSNLAGRLRTRCYGLTVIEERVTLGLRADSLGIPPGPVDAIETFLKVRAEAACRRLSDLARAQGVDCSPEAVRGCADDRIVERGQGADLIVIGRDGDHAAGRSVLIGSTADVMVIHFRNGMDAIGEAQRAFAPAAARAGLRLHRSFLSVTEAGLYHLTAKLAQEAAARGGTVGDPAYASDLANRVAAERESEHVRKRLFPALPSAMPYVSFYPMSKRRDAAVHFYDHAIWIDNKRLAKCAFFAKHFFTPGVVGFNNRSVWVA